MPNCSNVFLSAGGCHALLCGATTKPLHERPKWHHRLVLARIELRLAAAHLIVEKFSTPSGVAQPGQYREVGYHDLFQPVMGQGIRQC